MSSPQPPEFERAAHLINRAAEQSNAQLAEHRKLSGLLGKVKKTLATRPDQALQLLANGLQKLEPMKELLDRQSLLRDAEQLLQCWQRGARHGFAKDLANQGRLTGMESRSLGEDEWAVGPFNVTVRRTKQRAEVAYARESLLKDLPLDAVIVLTRLAELNNTLFQPTDPPDTLADLFSQAMRVAVVRVSKQVPTPLRAELIKVFEEVHSIRQCSSGTRRVYSRSRFIVELQALIQSDFNLKSTTRFQLEPAVIENAKNPRKSIFIPARIEEGFGEGVFYQALVLR